MIQKIFLFLVLIGTVCYLAGCGRVSKPVAPEGTTYPHRYIVTED